MEIPEKYFQFSSGSVYLLITGKQEAKLYKVEPSEKGRSQLNQLAHVSIEDREYSDNEGFFQSSGNGQVYGSGNVREDRQGVEEHMIDLMIEKLQPAINKHFAEHCPIYVFVPDYMKNRINQALDADKQKLVAHTWMGNFVNNPLEDVLKHFDELRHDTEPADPEAKKILNKGS